MKATFKVEVKFIKNDAYKDDPDAPFDGCLFETLDELQYQIEKLKLHLDDVLIYTIIEEDNNELYVSKGIHLCNRLGYLMSSDKIDFIPLNVKKLE